MSAAASPSQSGLKKIRISVFNASVISYLPQQIALVKGFYKEQGFDAQIIPMQASSTAVAALNAGEVDILDRTGTGLRAAARGLPIRLVECHGVRPFYLLALAPGIKSVKEVEGKAVGASSGIGSTAQLIAKDILQKNGVNQVAWQAVEFGLMYPTLTSGHIAAGVLSVSDVAKAQKDGIVFVNKIEDLPPLCDSGLLVTETTIKNNPKDVTGYIRAIQKAVTFMQTSAAESVSIWADWSKQDQQNLQTAYEAAQVDKSFSNNKALQRQAIAADVEFGKGDGSIKPETQLQDLTNLSLYPS